MGKTNKKREKNDITCKYCATFFRSPRDDERTSLKEKLCISLDKLVHSDSKVCDKFKIPTNIWCDKSGYWQVYEVCKHRIKIKSQRCLRCKQKKVIIKIIKVYDNDKKT